MRKIKVSFILLFAFAFSSILCKKSLELPPETQSGEETFGCLVNGEVFLPKGLPFGGPILSSAYQFVEGGYYFAVSAKNDGKILKSVSVHTDSLAIQEGKTYIIADYYAEGGTSAAYSVFDNENLTFNRYLTRSTSRGELKITRLDSISQIVSGTFWFDAANSNGEIVKVREGRFDLKYTR